MNWRSISIKPKIGRDLNSAKMHFVPNLEIVTSIGGELWPGQAQNGVNCELKLNLTLKDKVNHPPKIRILTKAFYLYGPKWVILA